MGRPISPVPLALVTVGLALPLASCTSGEDSSAAAATAATAVSSVAPTPPAATPPATAPPGTAGPAPAPGSSPARGSASPPATAATPTPDPGGGGTAGRATIGGGLVRYPSGLALSVPSAVAFRPSEVAVGVTPGSVGVLVTVTLVNGTARALDTTYTTVDLRVGPSRTVVSPVLDAAVGATGGLPLTVAPGSVATGRYAFAVPPGARTRLDLRVDPDLRAPASAVFIGAATAAAPTGPTAPATPPAPAPTPGAPGAPAPLPPLATPPVAPVPPIPQPTPEVPLSG